MSNSNVISLSAHSPIPSQFSAYILQGRALAKQAGISWDIAVDKSGVAEKGCAWNIRDIIRDGNPIQAKLRTFSTFPGAIEAMIVAGLLAPDTSTNTRPVSVHWQEFIKAYSLNHLLVARKSVTHLNATCGMLRLIATSTSDKEPWRLDGDDLNQAMSVAKAVQPSGQIAVLIASFVKTVIDAFHLADACPLHPSITVTRTPGMPHIRAAEFTKQAQTLRKTLLERKSEEKLPEKKAFWELMRIVFTEKPRNFTDAIRFAQAKVLALTGLRIGEVSMLPLDWKRTVDYRDRDGRPAGELGGFSRAVYLRYFAEKQGAAKSAPGRLFEEAQFIPSLFEGLLVQALEDVARLTDPLRKILKSQCETGRLFPMYAPEALLPAEIAYVHLTGNVLFRDLPSEEVDRFMARYREAWDANVLDDMVNFQRNHAAFAHQNWYTYAHRMKKKGLVFRGADGQPWTGRGGTNQFILVSDLERYVRENISTKVSDTLPFTLGSGAQLQPWELLFLVPKRALSEGRDELPCHPGRHIAIGVSTPEILGISIGQCANGNAGPALFVDYGLDKADHSLALTPHSLRHLQNTELFRLGVADTIITKRFNRRSVAQSYEYDHRSLHEELEHIELADEWEAYLGPKASTVAKLVESGRANGPIVKEFKRLQAQEGDSSAYSFLKAEADGFHATPYGHCLNSFTVDPCPTNLECFNGCRHLSATDLPENRRHLVRLQGKMQDALTSILARPSNSIGRDNQVHHAEVRLAGIERLLHTPAGERAFPNGEDLSRPKTTTSVLHDTTRK